MNKGDELDPHKKEDPASRKCELEDRFSSKPG